MKKVSALKLPFYISDASFQLPDRLCASTWLEHIPFAFWLTEALKPKLFVELGTYFGASYFAFCQEIQRNRTDCKCYAIDTWKGDEHSGYYEDHVFHSVREHNQKKYPSFSTLIRSTFDDSIQYFEDATIDLLHIDGFHTYEEVKGDFGKWLPKLSSTAVVLFHDINVKEKDFGVYKLWEELKQEYRYFDFFHGYGLGVLAVGKTFPPALNDLFSLGAESKTTDFVRRYFSRLGSGINYLFLYEDQVRSTKQ